MKNKIILTKKFADNLKLYGDNKKFLVKKVLDLKNHIERFGFDSDFFNQYDVKNLGDNYFRVKFIPYRIIIFAFNNHFEFIELFKRKGISDYKKYK